MNEPPGTREANGRLSHISKLDPQSSQSSETGPIQITDSARNLATGTLQIPVTVNYL